MGAELCDMEINFAQQLLKSQFPKINGLACTLYQEKKANLTGALIQNKVQIIYCKARHHWIVGSTFWRCSGEVKAYDSIFNHCDKETESLLSNLFQHGQEEITVILKSRRAPLTVVCLPLYLQQLLPSGSRGYEGTLSLLFQ